MTDVISRPVDAHTANGVAAVAPAAPAPLPAAVVMTREVAALLRAPFDDAHLGQLPKVTCRPCSNSPSRNCEQHVKRPCPECGNWMTTAHIHLTYAGHAEVTARLLAVDPLWDWEPVSTTAEGLPRFDDFGGLWIRLTVAGVPRLGYGDAEGKRRGPAAVKEAIGDAIRNAAMRFGVGLDLWGATFTEDDDPALVAERRATADPTPANAAPTLPPTPEPAPAPGRDPWDREEASPAIGSGRPPTEQPAPPQAQHQPTAEHIFDTGAAAIASAKSLAQLDQLDKLVANFETTGKISAGQAGRLRLKASARRDTLAATVPPPPAPPALDDTDGAVIGTPA